MLPPLSTGAHTATSTTPTPTPVHGRSHSCHHDPFASPLRRGLPAELGWEFVRWYLDEWDGGPAGVPREQRRATAARLFAAATLSSAPPSAPSPAAADPAAVSVPVPRPAPGSFAAALLSHGVLTPELRAALRRHFLDTVIRPAARALLAPGADAPAAKAPALVSGRVRAAAAAVWAPRHAAA